MSATCQDGSPRNAKARWEHGKEEEETAAETSFLKLFAFQNLTDFKGPASSLGVKTSFQKLNMLVMDKLKRKKIYFTRMFTLKDIPQQTRSP